MLKPLSSQPAGTSGPGRTSVLVLLFLASVLPMLAQAERDSWFLNKLNARQGEAIQMNCNPAYVIRSPFVKTILGLEVTRVVKGERTLIGDCFPFGEIRNGTISRDIEKGWRVACSGGTGRGKSHNNRFSIRLLVTKDTSSLEDAGIYVCTVHFFLDKILVKRENAQILRVAGKRNNATDLMRHKRQSQMDTDDYYYYDYDYQDNVKLSGTHNHHNLTELDDKSSQIEILLTLVVVSALSGFLLTS